ncbi:GntR family transcriptional regulator [Endozoicomonas gorgoniicola]|uniref:GntR family transcriptional regulator n=1 Tax=Endozoicomonas gorgoniicola TaxID=1234144 RepID=A0ABT3N159_9GAMM|nr:GntR family transcriptional regulator [Endozoicomonas gorgoniicola]MCW7555366.1 GntR family transcriptional regulator [Endozoicomonas gorgoniicola]
MAEKELSQTDSAYARLEFMVIFQQLEPGAMYSEKQLGEMLNMGRTPIREALQKLAWEQMVNIYPRRGIQIPVVTMETQLKLLEVRRPIEVLCAELAAEKATPTQKAQMEKLAEGIMVCARNHDDESFFYHLRQVHYELVAASRNEYIRQAMRPLQGLSRRFWFKHKEDNTEHPATLHAEVMKAVSSGDKIKAAQAANKVIDYLYEFTLKQLTY